MVALARRVSNASSDEVFNADTFVYEMDMNHARTATHAVHKHSVLDMHVVRCIQCAHER